MKNPSILESLRTPTAISFIVANTVPLLGAIFLDWSVFSLMFLFWIENVIIGMLNVVKMLTAVAPEISNDDQTKGARVVFLCLQIFLACFFTVHYGGFCTVHGVFVFAMFAKGVGDVFQTMRQLLFEQKLAIAVITIFISHLFSMYYNDFRKQERVGTDLLTLMARPYGRIIVLHITIIFGGFAALALGEPMWALILLLLLKTGIDLKAHIKEREKMTGSTEGAKLQRLLPKLMTALKNYKPPPRSR